MCFCSHPTGSVCDNESVIFFFFWFHSLYYSLYNIMWWLQLGQQQSVILKG